MVSLLASKYSTALIDQIEDAVQDSLLKAAKLWAMQPMPENPSAWLYRVANNQLIDQLRRDKKSTQIEEWVGVSSEEEVVLEKDQLDDGQLRMIFACCHPSIKLQEQLMLSLKLLSGLSVKEIARALLKNEEATKKAITRAKVKFKNESGGLYVPKGQALNQRLEGVLQVIYLLFNEGYKATEGDQLIRHDLCEEAIRLAFILTNEDSCYTSELKSLISLMLFKAARFPARIDDEGKLLTLEHQNRQLYRDDYMQWGWKFLHESSSSPTSSVYQLEAAIASYYTIAESYEKTNWKQILGLYNTLIKFKPSPIVKMSRLLVLSKVEGAAYALNEMNGMMVELNDPEAFDALKAELYLEIGEVSKAVFYFERAVLNAQNLTERRFLEDKLYVLKKN
jgi:RNA polymerase sigma-70 factor (ECF subfamily)